MSIKSNQWKQYSNDEEARLEVDCLADGGVAIALWTTYLNQYVDIVLTAEQTQELQEFLK